MTVILPLGSAAEFKQQRDAYVKEFQDDVGQTARALVVAFMAAEAQLGLVAKDLKLRDRVEQIMRAAQHSELCP